MRPIARRHVYGPRLRRFDPALPLFVRRRISTGSDDAGQQTFLEPGAAFDASSIAPLRLRTLFGNGYLTHDVPGTRSDVRNAPTAGPEHDSPDVPVTTITDADAPQADAPADDGKPTPKAKAKRAGA